MNADLESLKARVARLSVMIFDIDGTLTDGKIFWVPGSGWTQSYSVRDGMGIKRLQEAGMEVAAISGGDSLSAQMRMQSLGIKHVHFGSQDKVAHFERLLGLLKVAPEDCGYMGDEVVDLALLRRWASPPLRPRLPRRCAPRCTMWHRDLPGAGAAREVCEFILRHRTPASGS